MSSDQPVEQTETPTDHMWVDRKQAKDNQAAGRAICGRCNGTGNELYSMYRKCRACGGDGVSRGNEGEFND